jgi:DNA polymerase-3 subunit epsilon
MLLFVDTETSGLIDFAQPTDHPSQPHIVQLAALLCDDDEDCTVRETYQSIIRPDGWEIQTAAEAVHGISADYACRFGEALSSVLGKFYGLVAVADALGSGRLIAHNTPFDLRMILRDTGTLNDSFDGRYVSNLRPFCTMRAMTPRCRLPSRRRGEFKWPKLEEAYEHVFGTKPPAAAAHTALGDVTACRELFAEGRRREWWR